MLDNSVTGQGPEGNRLEHAMGAKTESLDPPHNYVPWIVVDGEHDNETQQAAMDNLLALVCKLYKVGVLNKIQRIQFAKFSREQNQPNVRTRNISFLEAEQIISNCLTCKLYNF